VTTHDNSAQDKIGASDPTLMTSSTGAVDGNPVDDLDDEATMIMPSGTLSASNSEDETVINHDTGITTNTPPLAETLVGESYEQPNDKNQTEADTLVGTPIGSATGSATANTTPPATEGYPAPGATTTPSKQPSPTIWIWAGASTLIITCIIIFALTSGIFGTTNNTNLALPEPTKTSNDGSDESWGGAPKILQVEPDTAIVQSPNISDTPDDTAATTFTAIAQPTEDVHKPLAPSSIESQTIKPEQEKFAAVAPVVVVEKIFRSKEEEVMYFVGQINNAKNANNLAPAEKVGTATYYLVKLIKASPNSPFVSQARSQIAKAHLVLAATARDGERWDEAQQHLDDAFAVRLPDSYQSN